jgi:pimeloyl-ACP methyl ester carboxylesterase
VRETTAAQTEAHTTFRGTSSTATSRSTHTVRSADGTPIAFDRVGSGHPLVLIDGALCYRSLGESGALADLLAPYFTVFTYDRRGRGQSGNTLPYAVDREVDDIAAIVNAAGGFASLWGMSSGAVLALETARRLDTSINKVAVYEAPLIVDDSRATTENDWDRIGEAVAADRRGGAVKIFMQSVGMPWYLIAPLRLLPIWSRLEAIAHTLPYDGAIVQAYQKGVPLPAHRWAHVTMPALVMAGGKSPQWIRHGNQALASALPNAQYRTLEGQTHMLKPKAHVRTLVEFLG